MTKSTPKSAIPRKPKSNDQNNLQTLDITSSEYDYDYEYEDPYLNGCDDNAQQDFPPNASFDEVPNETDTSTPKYYELCDINPYRIIDGYLVSKNPKSRTKYDVIGRRIEIVKILQHIETEEQFVALEFETIDGTKTVEIPRGNLTKQQITELLRYGADVYEHQIRHVLIHLNYQERDAELELIHDHVGWDTYNGIQVFKHANALGCTSTYRGNLAISPQGTYKQWKKLIEDEVMGYVPLELALVIGLSAPVVPLIAQESGSEVLLFHIYGDSSQGKTTATMIATSPFGLPHTRADGLIKTWNGTKNAIIGHFRNNFGLPMGLDEASMHGGDDFSRFIYLLANGRDKDRLNKDGKMQETAQWSTTIISNAEHSLLDKSNQNIGIQMRLLELGNITWTQSAHNADALKESLLKNYGHAGPKFVQYLMNIGTEAVIQEWQKQRRECFDQLPTKDRFSQRIADKLAIVIATANLAKEALNLNFNLDAIKKVLLQTESQSQENRDIGENAYNAFIETVIRYQSRFSTQTFGEKGFELWGKIISSGNKPREIYILPDKFKEIMHEAGFEDVNVILYNWREKNLLDCDSGKYTRKKTLGSNLNPRVHVIRVRDELSELDGSSQNHKNGNPQQRKIINLNSAAAKAEHSTINPNPVANLFSDENA